MGEAVGAIVGPILVIGLFVFAFVRHARRRAAMTPEQRQLEDQAREIRELKREQRRRSWD